MATVIPRFNMRRTVYDYARGIYYPLSRHGAKLAENDFAGARALAEWKQRVRQLWPKVGLRVITDAPGDMPRGERLRLRVAAGLNGLNASDVRVEFVARRRLPAADTELPALSSYQAPPTDGVWIESLKPTGEIEQDGGSVFALDAQPTECGQFDTEVRIYPHHELLRHPFEVGLMKRL